MVEKLSITVAIVFSLFGLILLLLFFHNTAESIQVFNITAKIAEETLHTINHLFPIWDNDRKIEDGRALVKQWQASGSPQSVTAPRSGYIQSLTFHHLRNVVTRLGTDIHVHVVICPGDFVTLNSVLLEVWAPRELKPIEMNTLRSSIILSDQRDMLQDPGFGMRQLTDIALRAMSPAVNDPTTAVNCIQYLQAIFEHLARLSLPSDVYHINDRNKHIILHTRTFEEYLQVFVEIGRVTTDNACVVNALLTALEAVVISVQEQERERLLLLQTIAHTLVDPAIQTAQTELDRTQLTEHLVRFEQKMHSRIELFFHREQIPPAEVYEGNVQQTEV